ncbi:MAG: hypothetical protein CMI09_12530 [Oceanospirillaceae bacterium]|nr:hypothetical protein [Oceanospirillaceae bacterium]
MQQVLKNHLIILLLVVMAPLQAAMASDDRIDELLTVSGFDMQIQQMPDVLKMTLNHEQQLPLNLKKAFISAIDTSFDAQKFKNGVTTRLKTNLSEQDLSTILAWYETPEAQKITAEENAASTPEAMMDMQMKAPTLIGDKDRMAFARRVDSLMGATDSAMSTQEYIGIAILSAMAATSADAAGTDMDIMKSMLSSQMAQQRQLVSDQIAVQTVYTYRNIDDTTLANYEKVLNQPAFINFYRSALEGMNRSFEGFISDWTYQLAQSGAL